MIIRSAAANPPIPELQREDKDEKSLDQELNEGSNAPAPPPRDRAISNSLYA